MDTSQRVEKITDGVQEIQSAMDRNCTCHARIDIYVLLTMKIDSNLQRGIGTIKDDKLSTGVFPFLSINTFDSMFHPENDVYRWLAGPTSSRNFNDARERRQSDTCTWFTNGTTFSKW